MKITAYIKDILEEKNMTLKHLHQELQHYDVEMNRYEYFWNKFKNDKLSSHELIAVSSILNIDLNKLTAMTRMTSKKKVQTEDFLYYFALENSSVKSEEAFRLYHKEENEEAILLISYHVEENWIVMEQFPNLKEKSYIKKELSLITEMHHYSPEKFHTLPEKERIQMVKEFLDMYAVLYPDYYEEDANMNFISNLPRETKMELMLHLSEFKDRGNTHFYFDVDKKFSDLEGKDVLIVLDLNDHFFSIEWFDFAMNEYRTVVVDEDMFGGEPISQEEEKFPQYNEEEIMQSLYHAYLDYRMNAITDEEYDMDNPIKEMKYK